MNCTCNWDEECRCYTEGENAKYECCPRGHASDICEHSFTKGDARYQTCNHDHGKFATCFHKDLGEFRDHCRSCPPPKVNVKPVQVIHSLLKEMFCLI